MTWTEFSAVSGYNPIMAIFAQSLQYAEHSIFEALGKNSHHRLGDFFDESVILFNQVVQILDLANFYKTNQPC